MKSVVTGLGRSGTHWLATWWGVPHEPLGLTRDEAYALKDAPVAEVQKLVDRLPPACVDSHLRYAIPQLRECGVRVLWLWREFAPWMASMERRIGRSRKDCFIQYQEARKLSEAAHAELHLEHLAPFGPPPTNQS